MKRYYLLLLLLVLVAIPAAAQRTFRAGLLAGANTSQIHGDNYWGWNQLGALGGLFVSTTTDAKFYYQMELQYSRKGSRKIANPNKGDFDFFELRLNYIEVPLLARYNYRKLTFEAGVSVGTLFKAREWDDNGEITPRDFRRLEVCYLFGALYNFNESFYLNVRTSNSFFPVKKFDVPFTYPRFYQNLFNKGMYNNLLSFSIGWRFGSGGSAE
jgi:hypothetical protein